MKESNTPGDKPPPLLVTNLRVPQLRGDLIRRDILMERMDLAQNYQLTVISAPAGFGKTTLLSQWVSVSKTGNGQDRVAWVSLETECDLRRFWTYIATALNEIQPGIVESALTLFDAPQPPIHTIARILINKVSEAARDFILILDDYHHVDDSVIHATLSFFIDHLPPNLHLIVASRSQPPLPLARWRASNQLYDLREDDLRFTSEEVAAFLNEIKGLNLSPQDITALEARMEGWVAGLQLVALSLRDADDMLKRQFVHDFTGSQKYILDYLVEEVLQQQPEKIRTFLMKTSVLDHLSAPLCNEITGQSDSQEILEYLERAHLFTVPLDLERRWYRYHNLFLDMLRHRLQQRQPENILELHRRAAAWYDRANQIDGAIRHSCAAQDWEKAIEIMEPAISTIWNQGEIRKIISWLGKLPDEYLDAHLQLSLYYSRALLLGGKMDAAKQRLQESEKILRTRHSTELKREDRLLLGTICAFQTTIATVTGETDNALALGHEALNLLPQENIDIRAHAQNSLGVNYYYLGEMEEANRACTEAGILAQQTGNLYLTLVAASYRAKALTCLGQLNLSGQVLRHALDLGSSPGLPLQSRMPAASVACASFGDLLYEWNRLEEAEQYLTEAIELGQRLAFGSALWSAYHALSNIKLARGDHKGAQIEIENAHRYRLAYTVPLPARLMDAEQARAQLRLGQQEAVERWADTVQLNKPLTASFVQEFEEITLARLYLFRTQNEQALELLDRLRLAAQSNLRKGHLIEILALTAVAQHSLGQAQQSLETLQADLQMAEPEGYLRTFVDAGRPMAVLLYKALELGLFPDYVAKLLTLFPSDDVLQPTSISLSISSNTRATEESLIEPLSQRELEVLHLMATGASNEGIADNLVIAPTTAKKHVSNILHKLGVENRTQAVARGRSLGLCD